MTNSNQVHVFEKFLPYLRLLQSYNREHFHPSNPNVQLNRKRAIGFTLFASLAFILLFLAIWSLFESLFVKDFETIAINLPMMASELILSLMYPALISKNRVIFETIDRLQQVINERELQSKTIVVSLLFLPFD